VPNPAKEAIVMCGSVGEIANDFKLGTTNGFDVKTETTKAFNRDIYLQGEFGAYKHTVWANNALFDEGQLRQRMAWALYQIIPIGVPLTSTIQTETWLQYYDIFVRHAFGSYKDILKEVSYNDVMSQWLSFYDNQSLQHNIDDGKGETHPDEVSIYDAVLHLFHVTIMRMK